MTCDKEKPFQGGAWARRSGAELQRVESLPHEICQLNAGPIGPHAELFGNVAHFLSLSSLTSSILILETTLRPCFYSVLNFTRPYFPELHCSFHSEFIGSFSGSIVLP